MDLFTALTQPDELAKLRVRGVVGNLPEPLTQDAVVAGFTGAPPATLDDLQLSVDADLIYAAANCTATLTPDLSHGYYQVFPGVAITHPAGVLAYQRLVKPIVLTSGQDTAKVELRLRAFK